MCVWPKTDQCEYFAFFSCASEILTLMKFNNNICVFIDRDSISMSKEEQTISEKVLIPVKKIQSG